AARRGLQQRLHDRVAQRVLAVATPRELGLERGPPVTAVFAGQGELHVAQRCVRRRLGMGAREPRAGVGVVLAKRGQPPLRFPLERLEGALGRECPHHRGLPPRTRPKSAEYRLGRRFAVSSRTKMGGSRAPLPRTGGAPARATAKVGGDWCSLSRCRDVLTAVRIAGGSPSTTGRWWLSQ